MLKTALIHDRAIVEPGARIGSGTRVWAFAHILGGASIGDDCNICDNVFIENDVVVGNRVTIKCGVQLWDGITVEDDVFIGPNATFTNDPFPRSKQRPAQFARTVVRHSGSIGANATILPGLTIGQNAMVGAGSVITRDVPPNAVVMGNPAQIVGYVTQDHSGNSKRVPRRARFEETVALTSQVSGTKVIPLPIITDLRGSLSFGQFDQHLPFQPKRYFVLYDVPTREVRGEHAHRTMHQMLACLRGSCSVAVDDGVRRQEFVLDTPSRGLSIGPLVWSTQFHFSPDCILLVLASDVYMADDYVRDYDEFLLLVRGRDELS